MLSITRGRSLATQAPAGLVGDECIPQAAQPPGLIPGSRTTCPAECTPRPRNLPAYRAACTAAEGSTVYELNASQVVPGEILWHCGHFLAVRDAECKSVASIADVPSVEETRNRFYTELRLEGAATTGWLLADLDTPVYCLGR